MYLTELVVLQLAGLPQLGFFWFDILNDRQDMDLSALAAPTTSLELLCNRGKFHEDQRAITGEVTLSPPWSPTKIISRSVDDFGCSNWHWLTLGHSRSILNQFSQGA